LDIRRATLTDCQEAEGLVVVIDVLRAFTTAAFAFAAGATEILPVGSVPKAISLRDRYTGALIMGEVDGLPVPGFDLSNSPAELLGRDLKGRRLIHRTSAGTQGLVRASRASHLLAACLCNVSATVQRVKVHDADRVTLVQTGVNDAGWGDEDIACADVIEALLSDRKPDFLQAVLRVRQSHAGLRFSDPSQPQFAPDDLDCAIAIDRFSFAMEAVRQAEQPVLCPVGPPGGS
jgi:2-phosphosulfolactate phosphatase